MSLLWTMVFADDMDTYNENQVVARERWRFALKKKKKKLQQKKENTA